MTDSAPNRRLVLAQRPHGVPDDECFRLEEVSAPVPADGQALVRVLYVSCDPAQRGWMSRDTYLPAIAMGEVIRSGAAGVVVESRTDEYPVGAHVFGMLGWQDYALIGADTGTDAMRIPPDLALADALSVFGITGLTAYFGVFDIGVPQAGETFVVSGAAGGVGSIAGQLAKVAGCRVIGIAGSAEKCRWVVDELGFDACIDYKADDVDARLRELAPDGIDIYFDNVGGDILDIVLGQVRDHARVIACGAISRYNDTELAPGPRNFANVVPRRVKIQGFILLDYAPRFLEGILQLAQWVHDGSLVSRVDVTEGLEHAPEALRKLFTGANIGKVIVHVADE
ncbi:MAG TPA: NADP-dependent oxidoreductase [Acidimicrobiia bacterium]|nr:NADP-dependent oxidoreductase [Acidimicrobiia bacterium]